MMISKRDAKRYRDRAEFEKRFHSRTLAYVPGFRDHGRTVVVALGADTASSAGHALAVCLFNQLARAHQSVTLVGEATARLECPSPFGHETIGDATVGLAKAINPFIEAKAAAGLDEVGLTDALVLGIGNVPGAHLRVGADGFVALAGAEARIVDRPASVWGALLAACLGATFAFHVAAAGKRVKPPNGAFSLWEFGAPNGADGPTAPGPVDVGRVLQVGAGAVGCALDFALAHTGLKGNWTIIDGDEVDVSNLNRQSLFVAADTDWPSGPAARKAPVAAHRLETAIDVTIRNSARWYGEDERFVEDPYDVLLALANDGGVRSALQARQPAVLLHATTSNRWQAQVHRHVPDRDDCIDCRVPPASGRMRCSTGQVQTPIGGVDAALPFLSMTAGVLLAGQLARLQHGVLLDPPENQVILDLGAHPRCMRR